MKNCCNVIHLPRKTSHKSYIGITLLFLPKKICKGKIKSFSVNTDTKISVPRFSNSLAAKTMTIRHKS